MPNKTPNPEDIEAFYRGGANPPKPRPQSTAAGPPTTQSLTAAIRPTDPDLWGTCCTARDWNCPQLFALNADGYWRLSLGHREQTEPEVPGIFHPERDVPFPYDNVGRSIQDVLWLVYRLRADYPGWWRSIYVKPLPGERRIGEHEFAEMVHRLHAKYNGPPPLPASR